MRESIRCCISCILPCGALDVIRIVHVSGRVEEIGGRTAVLAEEIMRTYPKHVLRKPPDEGDGGSRAVVLQPNAELHRGMIYFLMPVVPTDEKRRKKKRDKKKSAEVEEERGGNVGPTEEYRTGLLVSEKVRRGRVGVWRPHLESIDEMMND